MNQKELEALLGEALKTFMEEDSYLIECHSSERSICHRIASHLYEQVNQRKYDVDCEYNRDGFLPKSLMRIRNNDKGNVFPDIILHRRGTDKNELVIEAKFSGQNQKKDISKIEAYVEEMGYKFGVLLTIPKDVSNHFKTSWWVRDRNGKAVPLSSYKSSKDLDKDVKILNRAMTSTLKIAGIKKSQKITRKDVRRITEKIKGKL